MGRRARIPAVFTDDEHGSIFQYRFTAKQRRRRGSTGVRDDGTPEAKAAAQAVAERLFADALKGRALALPTAQRRQPKKNTSLEKLFARFAVEVGEKLAPSYVAKWASHFRALFHQRWSSLDEILEPGAIDRYASDRLAGNLLAPPTPNNPHPTKPGSVTVTRELVTLRRFLAWCKTRGHIEELPHFERVRPVSDYKPPDYTPADALALLDELPDRRQHPKRLPVREFFAVQWAQARRPGEIESLRWQDVDLRRHEMTVRPSRDKARAGLVIPLAPEAHQVLEELHAERNPLPAALIFGHGNYRRSLALAAERLGLPRPTRHNLRHFRLTELGHSPKTNVAALQFFAGHKNLSTTDRYIRSRTAAARAMLDGLKDSDTVSGRNSRRPKANDGAKKGRRRG